MYNREVEWVPDRCEDSSWTVAFSLGLDNLETNPISDKGGVAQLALAWKTAKMQV